MSNRIKNIIEYGFEKIYLLMGNRLSLALFEQFINGLQNSTKTFITYHQRPQRASAILTLSNLKNDLPQLAIVIQGPIITKDNFTFETLKLYKQLYPNIVLILSTWNDYSVNIVEPFYTIGTNVLLNDKPVYFGESNINLQIVSSKAGIKKAKELGVEYVIKTRTDQRMYAPNVAGFLFSIINAFPINSKIKTQRMRIVGISLNTFKYRMYGLSDMFLFGHIEDMMLFWDIPLDTRVFNSGEVKTTGVTLRDFAQYRVCEVYLTTEYLKNIGRKLDWTLKDSWSVFAEHFCVVDKESLDLYWGKYGLSEFRWKDYNKQINVFEELNFKEWLILCDHQSGHLVPEEVLDLVFE